MKKIGKLFLAVFIGIFCSTLVVNAASKCDYNEQAELNNAVANIKVSYEEAEAIIEDVSPDMGLDFTPVYYYFKVQVYNMPENVFIKVTNDINKEVTYLYYTDSVSGTLEFDWKDLDNVANLIFEVYSSNTTNCPNELYRKIELTLPRYNSYSSFASCDGNESYYWCQKYVTQKQNVDSETFWSELDSFKNQKVEDQKKEEVSLNRLGEFFQNNKITIFVISTIIVVVGVVTTVIVIKKRRSRLI